MVITKPKMTVTPIQRMQDFEIDEDGNMYDIMKPEGHHFVNPPVDDDDVEQQEEHVHPEDYEENQDWIDHVYELIEGVIKLTGNEDVLSILSKVHYDGLYPCFNCLKYGFLPEEEEGGDGHGLCLTHMNHLPVVDERINPGTWKWGITEFEESPGLDDRTFEDGYDSP